MYTPAPTLARAACRPRRVHRSSFYCDEPMVRHRARIRFRKESDLRLIGHQDLMRVWERLFRRAGVKLRMSEGFHPRPKLNLPSALALGVAGLDEIMDVEFEREDDHHLANLDELAAHLAAYAPTGLGIQSVERIDPESPLAEVSRVEFELPVPAERHDSLRARIVEVLTSSACLVDRGEDRKPIDVRPMLDELALDDGRLRIGVVVNREGGVRPRELLVMLNLADLEQQGVFLTRTRVELRT